MTPLVGHMVANQKETSDDIRKLNKQAQTSMNIRLDNMRFEQISGAAYDALTTYDNACIYVVSRSDHIELYKGSVRIQVGVGTRIQYGIVVKIT